jgi:hypothetical protein
MGKTPKPLRIAVHPTLVDLPEVQALVAKGHQVYSLAQYNRGNDNPLNLPDVDLILGPNCWRMEPELLPYLDLAIKGARGVKYPAKGKK